VANARLERGQRAPDFVLPRPDGVATRFYAVAGGRPAVLAFGPVDVVAGLRLALDDPGAATVDVLAVTHAPEDDGGGSATGGGEAVGRGDGDGTAFVDATGELHARYGLAREAPTAVVLDANLRVLGTVPLGGGAGAGRVRALVEAIPPTADDVEIVGQAPVLLIPGVLDEGWCRRLVSQWETGGNAATGVEASREGQRSEVRTAHKERRDHVVTDAALMRELVGTVGRRVMPELTKAFAYRATRFEGFKIACYDASTGGFFRAHRDNLSPSTAHRRFALTLNLNDPAEYEGGGLRFPEYGPARYRPRAGEALVFSCSHLHEVLDVTAGRRWVLLSFLFGEDGPRPGGVTLTGG